MTRRAGDASSLHLATQLYAARQTVRRLFPQTYDTVIAEYKSLIEGRMKADPSLSVLSAALALGQDAQRAGFPGAVLQISAAAVEMIENEGESA